MNRKAIFPFLLYDAVIESLVPIIYEKQGNKVNLVISGS